MSLPVLALAFALLLLIAYRVQGRRVTRWLDLSPTRVTPARARQDGVDFVPTRPFYLFGQHFSAIAAAGPIAGPILACQSFGWLPCLLWIGFGVALIGAVHDAMALAASVRHDGRSLAEITREQIGPRAGRAMLAFIWLALVYVIVAFTEITAQSFTVGPDELRQTGVDFHPGGAVAAASVLYLGLSVVLGLVQRFLRPPLWLATCLFVPAVLGVTWLGTRLSTGLLEDRGTWVILILLYCAVASVTPVWALLQPRGYLGGFVLFAAIAVGVIGLLFGGHAIEQPAWRGFAAPGATGTLVPFLFVTIACGACSGFHGLVCSGTTSKQIDRETHVPPIGMGAMLAEGFVAFIALTTVMIAAPAGIAGLAPGTIYGNGLGEYLSVLIGRENLPFAVTFGAMAFSTFVFDTLDVCTRLGRYILQELIGWRAPGGAVIGTLATVALPLLFLQAAGEGLWLQFWTLFGASNQLLAGLTLLTVAVWMRRSGRSARPILAPLAFVLVITLWALAALAVRNLGATRGLDLALVNGLSAVALCGLALFLLVAAARRWRPAA